MILPEEVTPGAINGARKKKLEKKHTENWHQRQLIQWVKQYEWGQYLFHIPNENQQKLSAMGVRAGVPDLMLPIPMHGYHGLFIELKRPGGKVSNAQAKWHQMLTEAGYLARVCYGWREAADELRRYMA